MKTDFRSEGIIINNTKCLKKKKSVTADFLKTRHFTREEKNNEGVTKMKSLIEKKTLVLFSKHHFSHSL